jgi:hypothetical protein
VAEYFVNVIFLTETCDTLSNLFSFLDLTLKICVCVCCVVWPMKCVVADSLLKLVSTFIVYMNVYCVNMNHYIAI